MQYIILCLVIKADDWYYLWMRMKPSALVTSLFPKIVLKDLPLFRSAFSIPFLHLIQSDGTKIKMLQCTELT
jgi:hypothetical protein